MKSGTGRRLGPMAAVFSALLFVSCSGKSPEAYLASGKEFLTKGNSSAAIIEFKNALEKSPALDEARFLLGKALLDTGEATGAALELTKALEHGYSSEAILPVLFDAQIAVGQFDKVIEKAPKVVLASDDSKAVVDSKLATAYLFKGESGPAKAAAQKVLALRPENPDARVILARVMAGEGDLAGARRIIDSVVEKNPAHVEALAFKGALLSAENRLEAAAQVLGKVLELRPRLVQIHAERAYLFMRANNRAAAKTQVEAMRVVVPNHPLTVFAQAMVTFADGDLPKAREHAQLLLKMTPNSGQALQLAGAIEYKVGKLVQAEDYLKRALTLQPEWLTTRRWLALTYLGLGQTAKAEEILRPALDRIDDDGAMLALVGETYLYLGDARRAEFFLSKAAKLDSKDFQKRTALAIARLAKGESEVALADLAGIASIDKGATADRVIMLALMERRDFAGALKANEQIIKKVPKDAGNYYFQGKIQLAMDDVAAARKSFEQALVINPNFFSATESLAALDVAANRSDEAKKRLEASVAADSKNWPAMLALANLLVRTNGPADEIESLFKRAAQAGKTELAPQLALIAFHLVKGQARTAISVAQDTLSAFHDNPEAVAALGKAQQAAGEYNQALVTLEKLAVLLPKSAMPLLRMAELHSANKKPDAAAKALRNALELSPGLLEAQRGLIALELAAGRSKAAVDLALEIQARRPKESIGYLIEGDIGAGRREWDSAINAYRRGIKQVPGSTELALKLQTALFEAKRATEAEVVVASWVKANPQDLVFRKAVGDIAAMRGDTATAIAQYRSLLGTKFETPEVLNNLAMAASQAGDRSALEFAEKANKLAPDQPPYMDTLARILADQGETTRAVELIKAASAKAPKSPEIRLQLARILIKAGKKQEARVELEELLKLDERLEGRKEADRLLRAL